MPHANFDQTFDVYGGLDTAQAGIIIGTAFGRWVPDLMPFCEVIPLAFVLGYVESADDYRTAGNAFNAGNFWFWDLGLPNCIDVPQVGLGPLTIWFTKKVTPRIGPPYYRYFVGLTQ